MKKGLTVSVLKHESSSQASKSMSFGQYSVSHRITELLRLAGTSGGLQSHHAHSRLSYEIRPGYSGLSRGQELNTQFRKQRT